MALVILSLVGINFYNKLPDSLLFGENINYTNKRKEVNYLSMTPHDAAESGGHPRADILVEKGGGGVFCEAIRTARGDSRSLHPMSRSPGGGPCREAPRLRAGRRLPLLPVTLLL